jgi:hypothetical protein
VTSYNAALMLRVEFGYLPWRSTGDTSGHAIVDYGWYSDSGSGVQEVYLWDPENNSRHLIANSDAFSSLSVGGLVMVW